MDGECTETTPPCPLDKPFQDDPDPALCMTSIQPQQGESIAHVYERRAACILDQGGLPPSIVSSSYDYRISPTGSGLRISLSSPITIDILGNTNDPLSLFNGAQWVIQNYASGSSTFPIRSLQLTASFQLSPWDPATGFSRLQEASLNLVVPQFNIYGVAMGPTTVNVDSAAGLSAPVGLVKTTDGSNGTFHLFVPFRLENQHTPVGGVGPFWAGVYGKFAHGEIVFEGLQFMHPAGSAQYEVGYHLTDLARSIVDAMPLAEFKSGDHKTQLLNAFDRLIARLDEVGDDRGQLAAIPDYIRGNILHLVDGPVGNAPADDVMAQPPLGSNSSRGLAYVTAFGLHSYFSTYYATCE